MIGNFLVTRPFTLSALCILVLLALAGVVSAAPAPAGSPAFAAALDSPPTLPIAADRFGWFWTFLENTLHSRGRMLQFGIIGMCIALYFMFRARG
jgi:hypothetical protein